MQMCVVDRALVSAENPPLGKRGDSMHGGQQLPRLLIPAKPNRRYMQLEGLQTVSDTVPTRLSAVPR